MTTPLRGDEIMACPHRVALRRGGVDDVVRAPLSPELSRRASVAEDHRHHVLAALSERHPGAVTAHGEAETLAALSVGASLILSPHLPDDEVGLRRARVQALWRLGRSDDRFLYAPMLIKSNEVTEPAATKYLLEASLDRPSPAEAQRRDGLGPRSTPTVTRNGLALAHATRVLQAMGHGDELARVAMIDRSSRVWWFDLASSRYPRFNLAAYDALYDERVEVVRAHDRWRHGDGAFPTQPFWHRDCVECPYAEHCERELSRRDDVSLTRFTSRSQQDLLRAHGVQTRADLARLRPDLARRARTLPDTSVREVALGRSIDRLDELIYRARVHVHASLLRASDTVSCPRADLEVDVDMESYGDHTYLWGAYVTLRAPLDGVDEGYRSFVEWGPLDAASEAAIFASFWSWFSDLRARAHDAGRSFAAYCFWSQAEDGAMNRAVSQGLAGAPSAEDLQRFRTHEPAQWIDLHDEVKRQIQTDGPLGLKKLARAAGFEWRDENPSGEASMLWYEVARGDDESARASRRRLLEYNEDDCRATKALREWLNGPAQGLAHRDEPVGPSRSPR